MFALRLYERALARRPMLTQAISAGVLAGVGDGFSQLVVEGRRIRDYDSMRTARFMAVISAVMAPALCRWLRLLERIRGSFYPLKRMIIDQAIAAPVCTFGVVTCLRVFESHSLRDAVNGASARFWPILSTNYKIWPLVQLFNFYFVPLYYRIIFIQIIGIFWNAYLSYMTQASPAIQ